MDWPQNAYVGQKVARFRDAGPHEHMVPLMNQEVTISWVGTAEWYGQTCVVIDLVECPSPTESPMPKWQRGWCAEYYRPLTSRPTSISIFTAMLGPKQKETIDG